MALSKLRLLDTQSWTSASLREGAGQIAPLCALGQHLVQTGMISGSDAELAQIVQGQCDAPIDRVLQAEGLLDEDDALRAQATRAGLRQATDAELESGAETLPGIDARELIWRGLVPLRGTDGILRLAVDRPEASQTLGNLPSALCGHPPLIAPRHAIQGAMATAARTALTAAAEARPAASESCRTWRASPARRGILALAVISACVLAAVFYPTITFGLFAGWAALTLIISALLKTAAVCGSAISGRPEPVQPPLPVGVKLPKVSILVPLYRETRIAQVLIKRLSRLTYPKCLLDVILVLEETDDTTRQTVSAINLPPWMRTVIVPDGQPRTKPRAMNYALDFCEGDIVGIFDAEDAPAPDQITQIARRFAVAPPDVVCLQGILDYYNPRQNWLARCFTIEYATWFRVMLPGMARLGLAIPLGGTTLYFRGIR
ncbi:MAG: glycosyltransferase [Roseovarius sp.]